MAAAGQQATDRSAPARGMASAASEHSSNSGATPAPFPPSNGARPAVPVPGAASAPMPGAACAPAASPSQEAHAAALAGGAGEAAAAQAAEGCLPSHPSPLPPHHPQWPGPLQAQLPSHPPLQAAAGMCAPPTAEHAAAGTRAGHDAVDDSGSAGLLPRSQSPLPSPQAASPPPLPHETRPALPPLLDVSSQSHRASVSSEQLDSLPILPMPPWAAPASSGPAQEQLSSSFSSSWGPPAPAHAQAAASQAASASSRHAAGRTAVRAAAASTPEGAAGIAEDALDLSSALGTRGTGALLLGGLRSRREESHDW